MRRLGLARGHVFGDQTVTTSPSLVFVVGAGASKAMSPNMPVGAELAERIAHTFHQKTVTLFRDQHLAKERFMLLLAHTQAGVHWHRTMRRRHSLFRATQPKTRRPIRS